MTFDKATAYVAAPLLFLAHYEWTRRVQATVPEPYLDEFFHIPQAAAYWQGNWTHWDNKITTPPGVYLWSVCFSKLLWYDSLQNSRLSPYQLRYTNAVLPHLLIVCIYLWQRSVGGASQGYGNTLRRLCIFAFPLFFFFSGLYYTDVFSALTVMYTYSIWQAGLSREAGFRKLAFQALHVLSGLLSLASRQTNIFWVAVFMGGLQAVHTIKKNARVYDPPIEAVHFGDLLTTILSLATSALSVIPQLLLDLWPHLALLASFTAFVVWNGGVVLGDKSNHVATIHLAQMLYIWPFVLFFSWPVLLPYLVQPRWLLKRLPRYWLVVPTLLATTAVVRYNTIIHEFLLADNRHYTFYVFKILRTNPWLWEALVPVYAVSAWLSCIALGGGPGSEPRQTKEKHMNRNTHQESRLPPQEIKEVHEKGNNLSFLFVWLISTSLSLVTAPLVEPRYFMVPWLIWRLHVLDHNQVLPQRSKSEGKETMLGKLELLASMVARESFLVELLWSMVINFVTCRLFLEHEFRWPHSPDEVQRFMW